MLVVDFIDNILVFFFFYRLGMGMLGGYKSLLALCIGFIVLEYTVSPSWLILIHVLFIAVIAGAFWHLLVNLHQTIMIANTGEDPLSTYLQ